MPYPAPPTTAEKINSRSQTPIIRLDMDVNSVPPDSEARYSFVESLRQDLASSAGIQPERVQVNRIRRSPDMDWLTVVEFQFYPLGTEDQVRDQIELEQRYRLLKDKIQDQTSDIYKGKVRG